MLADAACGTLASETECLLYATYWFRPTLSELIGAATESAAVNREANQRNRTKEAAGGGGSKRREGAREGSKDKRGGSSTGQGEEHTQL